MLAVPERRVTEGFTPTPSSRQTISTTGLPRKGSASPEAWPSSSPGPQHSSEPGCTPSILTSTVTEEA